MATSNIFVNPLPKINSIPNLRLLCKRSGSSTDAASLLGTAAVYRSSKPDRITLDDLDEFRKLGIQCIVDFRSKEEYLGTDGHRMLDREYVLYNVIIPKENYKPGQCVKYEPVLLQDDNTSNANQTGLRADSNNGQRAVHSSTEKRHFLLNFFSFKYVKTVFNRLPWHLWCLGLLHLLWDICTGNSLKTFRKFIAINAVNTGGIFGQYVDIVEVSQPAICSALKLISDPNNLPALINCAYGKDRTGIMSALILTCLGMPKEYVVEEYALSTEGLEPIRHLLYKDIVEKHHLNEEFCSSKPSTMRDLLTYIEDRYKSVEQYMVSIGFSEEEQLKLKENLEAFDHKFQK